MRAAATRETTADVRKSRHPRRAGRSAADTGFTIVELIAVIMLLGILSVVAFGRFVRPSAFAPGIVVHTVILEVRGAQQLAASRADALVTLLVDRDGPDWRIRVMTDVDGLVRSETVAADNTTLRASSGAADAQLSAAVPLLVTFNTSGDLASVSIGATAGDPASGINLELNGDSQRLACIYPTGYTADAACG